LDAHIIVARPDMLLNWRKLLTHRVRGLKQDLRFGVGQLLAKLFANAQTWKNVTAYLSIGADSQVPVRIVHEHIPVVIDAEERRAHAG